jgi:hypothetical protein
MAVVFAIERSLASGSPVAVEAVMGEPVTDEVART